MIAYLTIIPGTVFVILYICYILELRKHDKVLYKFCQLRRDVMSILRRDFFTINERDYLDVKQLLETTNDMIHYYNRHKKTTFNMSWFIEAIKETRKYSEKIKIIAPTNKDIIKLYQEFSLVLFTAFFQYTPLLRSKFILSFLIYVFKFLAKSSIEMIDKSLEYLIWLKNESKELGAFSG